MRLWTALVALLAVACARGATVEKLTTNTYRVSCGQVSLDQCLAITAGNVCDRSAYFVERGISDVNHRGPSESPVVSTSSEAIIRCGPDTGWGEQGKALMAGPRPGPAPSSQRPPSPPPPPPAPVVEAPKLPVICAPGSTQACVGVAGCAGGQACVPDGTGYSPCDCGPSPALPPAPPAPAPAAAD